MSTALPKAITDIRRSEKDSQADYKLIGTLVFFVVVGAVAIYAFLFSGSILKSVIPEQYVPTPTPNIYAPWASQVHLTPTVTATLVMVSMPTAAVMPTPVPLLLPSPVALLPSPPPPPPPPLEVKTIVEYVPVEKIVERTVEIAVFPTPTPVLQPGNARICIYVEGATGVYLNGEGKAGNSCFDYQLSSPVNDYVITITR